MYLKTFNYGDQQFARTSDLETPSYYKKSEIEGENRNALVATISKLGVKRPIVINDSPGRHGIIIDGVETYKIAKELGLEELPVYILELSEEQERELHYALSIRCREYSIDEIIAELKSRNYSDYFPKPLSQTVHEIDIEGQSDQPLLQRKRSFILRYESGYEEYLERLRRSLMKQIAN